MEKATLRLFLGFTLPLKQQQEIGKLIKKLTQNNWPFRWVSGANLHLTLKFLDEVEKNKITDIVRVVKFETGQCAPFWLSPGFINAYPSWKKVRVLVLEYGAPSNLAVFKKRIEEVLSKIGFQAEDHFMLHLTLARVKGPPAYVCDLASCAAKLSLEELTRSKVEKIDLYQSILTPHGSIYKILTSIPLGKL